MQSTIVKQGGRSQLDGEIGLKAVPLKGNYASSYIKAFRGNVVAVIKGVGGLRRLRGWAGLAHAFLRFNYSNNDLIGASALIRAREIVNKGRKARDRSQPRSFHYLQSGE